VTATLVTLLAVLLGIPDENDYALASRLKHARLAALPSPKIVFVGGSNLSYGLDSLAVERATGRPVVNMGMNGYFGVRFMLAEVEPALRAGDTVVLSFEYDSFYKSIDGDPTALLMVVKSSPDLLLSLTTAQLRAILPQVPFVAQQKLMRLIRQAVEPAPAPGRLDDNADAAPFSATWNAFRNTIETLDGFDERGDMTSHLDMEWPFQRADGVDLTAARMDPDVLPFIDDFARRQRAQGVTVVLHYGPVEASFYRRHQPAIEGLHRHLAALPNVVVPSTPDATVLPDGCFFDTVYHLNDTGRDLRSARVATDLQSVLSAAHAASAKR
jgi:hypothetical protein